MSLRQTFCFGSAVWSQSREHEAEVSQERRESRERHFFVFWNVLECVAYVVWEQGKAGK